MAVEIPTRYAYAVKLKTKGANEICEAFQKIYDDITNNNRLILKVESDEGREFTINQFTELLESLDIRHQIKEPGDRYSLGIIDRLCRTLKEWIEAWKIEKESANWSEALPEIIEKYNEHQIQTLHASPKELIKYGKKYENAQKQTAEQDKPALKKFEEFKVGDRVRIRERPYEQKGQIGEKSRSIKSKLIKGRDRWSTKVWTISNIENLSFYLTDDFGNTPKRSYRHHDLLKVSDESTDVNIK